MNRAHLEVAVAPDWQPLDPAPGGRMMGGTERSALMLAEGLAARGWSMTVRGGGWEGTHAGVRHIGPWEAADATVVVCVEAPCPSELGAARRIAWSHSATWPASGVWDGVVAASAHHGRLLSTRGTPALVLRTPVPVPAAASQPRDRFLYASSPDRGLHRLLAMWPEVWRRYQMPLSIAYDVRGVLRRRRHQPGLLGERLREIEPMLDQAGVVVHGPLSVPDLEDLRARSALLLYPLDPVVPHSELLGLSVLDACAAGCPPILSPVDCFPSEYAGVARLVDGYDAPVWLDAISEVLQNRDLWAQRARAFAVGRDREIWLDGWEALLSHRARTRTQASARTSWGIITHGVGFGETAHARMLAEAAMDAGIDVRVVVRNPAHAEVLTSLCETRVEPDAHAAVRCALTGADRLVLASSLTCGDIVREFANGAAPIPVASLDPAWPVWLRSGDGLDVILSCAPPAVFATGASGGLRLAPGVLDRTRCVGPLPPSVERIGPPGRGVFVYLNADAAWTHAVAPLLTQAFEVLSGLGLSLRQAGSVRAPSLGSRVLRVALSHEAFAREVADAALVINSGPCSATTALALAAGVRVLVLTPRSGVGEPPSLGEREGIAYARASFLRHLALPAPVVDIVDVVLGALDTPARSPAGGGGARAVAIIESLTRRLLPVWRPPELRPLRREC